MSLFLRVRSIIVQSIAECSSPCNSLLSPSSNNNFHFVRRKRSIAQHPHYPQQQEERQRCFSPNSMSQSSFLSKILEPGGGVALLPFVRLVICFLLLLTVTAAAVGVARIHMIILSILSTGLLISLWFFETEFKKMQSRRSYSAQQGTAPSAAAAATPSSKSTETSAKSD